MSDWYWTAFWAVTIVAMVVADVIAATNNRPNDTLSEHFWRWLGRSEERTGWIRARRIVFLSFVAWLVAHIFTGWV